VKPALLALQTADARLREIDKPQILALRKVIDRDILRLQALPSVDVVNMGLRIDMLVEAIDRLPLASDRHPRPEKAARPEQETGTWPRLAREIWQDVRNMVRIQRMDQPELPLLEPDQAYFLRENLKLCLLTARVALLQRDEATYRSDLKRATEWLKRYFNTDDPVGKNALLSLQQLGSSAISIDIPDVSQSLGAVNNYKLALERKKP
jgi:uroporphyrin-3 C-methyltransferase